MTLECFMVPEKLLRHMRVTKAGGEKTNVHTSHVRTIATFILILYITPIYYKLRFEYMTYLQVQKSVAEID